MQPRPTATKRSRRSTRSDKPLPGESDESEGLNMTMVLLLLALAVGLASSGHPLAQFLGALLGILTVLGTYVYFAD